MPISTVLGKTHIDPAVAGRVLQQAIEQTVEPATLITEKLTRRETAILRLLASGLGNRDIAGVSLHIDTQGLSEGTVRNAVSSILTKLEVADRIQAAILAIKHGLADTQ